MPTAYHHQTTKHKHNYDAYVGPLSLCRLGEHSSGTTVIVLCSECPGCGFEYGSRLRDLFTLADAPPRMYVSGVSSTEAEQLDSAVQILAHNTPINIACLLAFHHNDSTLYY